MMVLLLQTWELAQLLLTQRSCSRLREAGLYARYTSNGSVINSVCRVNADGSSMNLKKLRLSGALLAVAALVVTPPLKFGYDAVRGSSLSMAKAASVKTVTAKATPKRAVVARCTKATRTVSLPVREVRSAMGKEYGFTGTVKVSLCTDKRGTKVYGQSTVATPIDTADADVQLKIGEPKIKRVNGTTTITRPARATITTKWNNEHVLVNMVKMVVTPKGAVSVSLSAPIVVK